MSVAAEVLDRKTRRAQAYRRWLERNPAKPRDRMRIIRARRIRAEAERLSRPVDEAWQAERLSELRKSIADLRDRLAH